MDILRGFEKYDSFLSHRTEADELSVAHIFDTVADELSRMGEEKLSLPYGFVRDLRLYVQKLPEIVQYFDDIERKYLLLTDLHGYLKLKGKL